MYSSAETNWPKDVKLFVEWAAILFFSISHNIGTMSCIFTSTKTPKRAEYKLEIP